MTKLPPQGVISPFPSSGSFPLPLSPHGKEERDSSPGQPVRKWIHPWPWEIEAPLPLLTLYPVTQLPKRTGHEIEGELREQIVGGT